MKIEKLIQMKCGEAYVVSLDSKQKELIEIGDVFLPNENEKGTRPYRFKDFGTISDSNKRVITICTFVGCCYGCKFCASRRSFQRILTKNELIGQVEFCIKEGLKHGRLPDPNQSKEFHVLYTRMGEPCANINNVIESMYELVKRYPHVRIGVSTSGIRSVKRLLEHPEISKHIMLQFSAHGTDEETRSQLLGTKTGETLMSLKQIAEFTKKFRKLNPRQVSLNFILLKNKKYDFNKLREYFDTEDVYIRLSPLNVTINSNNGRMEGLIREEDVLHKKPFSSDELKLVIANLEESGFAYAYAPAIDEEIKYKAACGQALEMLNKEDFKTF